MTNTPRATGIKSSAKGLRSEGVTRYPVAGSDFLFRRETGGQALRPPWVVLVVAR